MSAPAQSQKTLVKARKRRKKRSASDQDPEKSGDKGGDKGSGIEHKETGLDCSTNTQSVSTQNQRVEDNQTQNISERIAESNRTLYDSNFFCFSQPFADMYGNQFTSTPVPNQFPGQVVSPNFVNPSQQMSQQISQQMAQRQYMNTGSTVENPPKWATDLIDDVKQIKLSLAKIDNIEKTVNSIDQKVTDLESKVKNIDTRVQETESACSFISDQADRQKQELSATKLEVKDLNKSCRTLQEKVKLLNEEKSGLESKLVDLESRSMQENLLFYGVPEESNEDCEKLVKGLCKDKLKLDQAESFTLDRVHRVGSIHSKKPRPIVAKFHSYRERETVRKQAFEKDTAKTLKESNLGVGVQWPKQIRDARRELRPIMIKEREKGKSVRFVKDKLYVNNRVVDMATYEAETAGGAMEF